MDEDDHPMHDELCNILIKLLLFHENYIFGKEQEILTARC